jgi:hypothetical protein
MEPISRKEAATKGLKKYYTGQPCKAGHVTERYVRNWACVICEDDYQLRALRRRNEEHPEKNLWRNAKYRARDERSVFAITVEDIIAVWPQDGKCPVLGIPLVVNRVRLGDNSPSLDRINPHGGYVPSNIIIMSHKANRIKNNETDPAIFRAVADWMENAALQQRS